jgi:mercuric reductase
MAVIVIVLGIINRGPAWAQGTTAHSDQGADTITLKIEGWTCRSCEKDIRHALLAVPGVKAAEVSYARGGAVVTTEPGRVSSEQLIQAVEKAGTVLSDYRATEIPNGSLPESGTSTGGLPEFLKGVLK